MDANKILITVMTTALYNSVKREIEIERQSMLLDIKAKVEAECSLRAGAVGLMLIKNHVATYLDWRTTQTAEDCGIDGGSTLYVMFQHPLGNPFAIPQPTIFRITLKSPTFKRDVVVDLVASSTIHMIAEYVEPLMGFNPSQQRLIFNGRQMEPSRTAGEYNITDGAVVYVILALRGS